MWRNVWMILPLAVVTWAFPAQAQTQGERPIGGPAPAAPAPPNPDKMKQLLRLWAKQSTRLKSLDVTISRVDESPAWGDAERFEGRALFLSPNLAWLDFKRVGFNDQKQKVLTPHERIICTGTEVWQYRSPAKQIIIHKLHPAERQRALEEGPLPFLFNFREEEAERRYTLELKSEDAKSYVIKIIPILPIDKECFSVAFVRLDRKYLLPTQVHLIMPDEKSTKTFTLTAIKPNEPVMPDNFKGQVLGPPWVIVRNVDDAAPGAAGPPQQTPTHSQPAALQRSAAPARRR